MTRVRIGIVSWNTAELLERCLAALPSAADGLDFDVVLVDNDSSDSSVEVARRHPKVTVLTNDDNVGYARAMNQALGHSLDGVHPEVLIALNPDTEPPPGSLTQLVSLLLADPTIGLVVPKLINPDGSVQHSVFRFPSPFLTFVVCAVPLFLQRGWLARSWWLDGRTPHDEAVDIDWGIGAVHVIRSSALSEPFTYCERWFMYVEDLDLCWRLGREGWRCRLEPSVEVLHISNASGVQAWGDQRRARWLEATYDWYRLRRGVAAARRWAFSNTVGAMFVLQLSRMRYRVLGKKAGQITKNRVVELRTDLPRHRAMWHEPDTTFLPPEAENYRGITQE